MFPYLLLGGALNKNVDLIPGVGPNEQERARANAPGRQEWKSYYNAQPQTKSKKKANNKNSGSNDDGYYQAFNSYSPNASTTYSAPPAYNPADMAYLDDLEARTKRQHASARSALDNGLTSLRDSYNNEVTDTNRDRSRMVEDFEMKRGDTMRGKDSALGRVDRNARTLADSLRRRIGMASGSGSSAYQITAPGAVAREASEDRSGVVEDYGVNFRNLASAEGRAKSDFEELLKDLEAQRKSRESDFRSGIYDRQNEIDTSLSEIARQRALLKGGGYDEVRSALKPYASAIDERQGQIDSLFDKFRTPYSKKPVNVRTPDLRKYTVDNAVISSQTAAQDPYAEALRRRQLEDEEETYNPYG